MPSNEVVFGFFFGAGFIAAIWCAYYLGREEGEMKSK